MRPLPAARRGPYDAAAGRHPRGPSAAPEDIMGFQDRGYFRDPYGSYASVWSGVGILIALNVGIWLANFVLSGDLVREVFPLRLCLNDIFSLHTNLIEHPLHFWQLLTYGFLHDGPSLELQEKLRTVGLTQRYSPFHLLGNMLMLFFFGREVEGVMGRAEFLRFYCAAIVMAGIAWVVGEQFQEPGIDVRLVGASGGVMAVLAVFIWYFPQQTVYFWGVLPIPVWALGVLYLAIDFGGAWSGGSSTDSKLVVAHVAHLAGAVFGLLYAWRGWSLEDLGTWAQRLFRRRPSLKVVSPSGESGEEDEASLAEAVDRILAKISRSGEGSLTPEERDTLARASRRLKDRSR
jgi:membrane associated rhomboid family serine protease